MLVLGLYRPYEEGSRTGAATGWLGFFRHYSPSRLVGFGAVRPEEGKQPAHVNDERAKRGCDNRPTKCRVGDLSLKDVKPVRLFTCFMGRRKERERRASTRPQGAVMSAIVPNRGLRV